MLLILSFNPQDDQECKHSSTCTTSSFNFVRVLVITARAEENNFSTGADVAITLNP